MSEASWSINDFDYFDKCPRCYLDIGFAWNYASGMFYGHIVKDDTIAFCSADTLEVDENGDLI